MAVVQVKDRTKVRPDCVYVIPPGKDMSILRGVLHLHAPAEPRGLRLPVDIFLRSLAEDSRDLAIGVILSGMGSDGTLGLRLLKRQSCFVIAQDEASCVVYGMPKAAVDAGVADVILPLNSIANRIAAFVKGGQI